MDFIVRIKSRYVISWKRPPYTAAADIPQPKAVREANALAGVRPPYRFGHAGRMTLPLPLPHDLPMAGLVGLSDRLFRLVRRQLRSISH